MTASTVRDSTGPESRIDPAKDQPKDSHVYRYDVEGLRALAVGTIILFHFGVRGFSGGFIGVDIFFVISGYLISGLLLRDMRVRRYSISDFYCRRILRIFPNLIVCVAVTSAICAAVMLPETLERYATSVIAALTFWSNFYFAATISYFRPEAGTSPLIHTWSLAVEEQFYIFWPFILLALSRLTHRMIAPWLALIVLVSLAVSIMWLRVDDNGAFYLIPSRVWEFTLGALASQLTFSERIKPWIWELVAAAGLLVVVACVKLYSDQTPFPGLAALPPSLGTMVIIVAGTHHRTWITRLLSLPPMVLCGQMSYSLYLWHWPIIVLAHTVLFLRDSWQLQAECLAVTFVVSWLAWQLVERPFRAPKFRTLPALKIFLPATAATMLLVAGAGVALAMHGFPDRLSPALRQIAAFENYDGDAHYRAGSCFVNSNRAAFAPSCLVSRPGHRHVLLIGDSHAAQLWPGLAADLPGTDILQATRIGCPPVLRSDRASEPCQVFFRDILTKWLPAHPVDAVILAGNWQEDDIGYVAGTLKQITPYAPVVLVGPVPQYETDLPRLIVMAHGDAHASLLRRYARPEPFVFDARLRRITTGLAHVSYASPIEYLCFGGQCQVLAGKAVPLQFDYGHLTAEGSRVLAPAIVAALPPPRTP